MGASAFAFVVTFVGFIFIACSTTFPLQIAMIVIGAKYKDECPVEDMIPIYLIVAGSAGLFANFCSCGIGYTGEDDDEEKTVGPVQAIALLFLFALVAWFICGNVWIYKNYEPNYTDPESAYYCNKVLYLFAFWVTNSYYIIFGFIMVCVCLCGTSFAAAGASKIEVV